MVSDLGFESPSYYLFPFESPDIMILFDLFDFSRAIKT